MEIIVIVFLLVMMAPLALSIPPAVKAGSIERFLAAMFLSSAGILLPISIFFMSILLVPGWKGGCRLGWLDCFHVGKLALTPLVLWACAAFYVSQILKPGKKHHPWIDLGLCLGAITSTFCLALGAVIHGIQDKISLWLLVPLYVSIWYTVLYARSTKSAGHGIRVFVKSLFGTVPLWVASFFWSWVHYQSLRDSSPDCFVVTAALHGHEKIVGPLEETERLGVPRAANKQLRTFWAFERIWAARYPRFHRVFRCCYNRFGPLVASRIKSKLMADMVYLLLKPCEAVAAIIVCVEVVMERRKQVELSREMTTLRRENRDLRRMLRSVDRGCRSPVTRAREQ